MSQDDKSSNSVDELLRRIGRESKSHGSSSGEGQRARDCKTSRDPDNKNLHVHDEERDEARNIMKTKGKSRWGSGDNFTSTNSNGGDSGGRRQSAYDAREDNTIERRCRSRDDSRADVLQRHDGSTGRRTFSSRYPARESSHRPVEAGHGTPHEENMSRENAAAVASSEGSLATTENEPFTEAMWESTSCREVLDAMFFTPHSAVRSGLSEEYKELEGEGRIFPFLPKKSRERVSAKYPDECFHRVPHISFQCVVACRSRMEQVHVPKAIVATNHRAPNVSVVTPTAIVVFALSQRIVLLTLHP